MNTRAGLFTSSSGEKLCVYCDEVADSNDHAPPRCLMLPPLPSNLITLPACKTCNNGFSFHENIVRALLSTVGNHPHLIEERLPGGWLEKTLARSPKIRAILDSCLQTDGSYKIADPLLESVRAVFFKTEQGLFYGLYDKIIPTNQLVLIAVEDQRHVKPEEVIGRNRPDPLVDITDEPLPEISACSWHSREPIFTTELVDPVTGKKIQSYLPAGKRHACGMDTIPTGHIWGSFCETQRWRLRLCD